MADDELMDVLTRRRHEPVRSGDADAAAEPLLPDPSQGYVPHARPWSKPLYTLHCVLGQSGYRSFQYVHLDSDSRFSAESDGHVIRLRFCGSRVMAVTIRGRSLEKLYHYIGQHRVAWVMCADTGRDFGSDDEPVITKIDIDEEKDGEATR